MTRKRKRPKIYPKLLTITIIKRVTILDITSSQKSCCCLDNIHINDLSSESDVSTQTSETIQQITYIWYFVFF